MKRNILSLFCLAALFAACSSDNEIADSGIESGNVEVTFTLALSDSPTSRADQTWDDPYTGNEGTTPENMINNLQVYLYDSNGNLLKKVDEVSYDATSNNSQTYRYVGTLKAADLGISPTTEGGSTYQFSGKVLVLANCADYTPTDNVTITDQTLTNLSYTFNPTIGNTLPNAIPMWGVATLTDVVLRQNFSTELGNIDLLRAMAKIEVTGSADFADNGYTITDVTLSRYNTSGLCLPKEATTVAQTTDIMMEGGMNIPTGVSSAETLSLKQGDSWYIYVPECQTAGTSDTYLAVTINKTADTGTSETHNLFFTDYTGKRASAVTQSTENIVRNHYWKYEITKFDGAEVTITVDVVPWARYNHDAISM